MWWTIGMCLTKGGRKRALYARKHKIFAEVGDNVMLQPRIVPLYSELIKFHNNIVIARNVDFCTHDVMNRVYNRDESKNDNTTYLERVGCIEIMDNVFIGSNSVVLYNIRIGPNVIIGAGSVVTRDCEPNSVYVGVPARKISTWDEYWNIRAEKELAGEISTTKHNQNLTKEEVENAWRIFHSFRGE